MESAFDPAAWVVAMNRAGYRVAVWVRGSSRSLAVAFPDRAPDADPLPHLKDNSSAVVELLTVRR